MLYCGCVSIHDEMRRAANNAPYLKSIPVLADVFPFETREEEGDDSVVDLNPKFLPDEPNDISIDAADSVGFRGLFEIFEEVTGGYSCTEEYIRNTIEHEGLHLSAARSLGARAARIGLHVYSVRRPGAKRPTFAVQPCVYPQVRTTRLGAALISAHPHPLSESDRQKIAMYGYSSVVDLARRAIERNRARKDPGELLYPVPRGFSQSTDGE